MEMLTYLGKEQLSILSKKLTVISRLSRDKPYFILHEDDESVRGVIKV
jgi:hypothetical protein